MKFPKENIIDQWLDQHGDPEVKKLVERNLAIAHKVQAILKEKNIKPVDFAKMLGKKPSEVSKWLSGQHNLTTRSIVKMEIALGVNIMNIEPIVEHKYVYMGIVKGTEHLTEKINDYEESQIAVYGS